MTIAQMFANNLIPVTIGNFIGAAVLALILYFCHYSEAVTYTRLLLSSTSAGFLTITHPTRPLIPPATL